MSLLLLAAAGVAVVPSGQTFECTPTRVWDGDGPIWCAEGPRIRLSGIAAREIDGTCRSNQPCPKASAEQSRDALARLVGQPRGTGPHGHDMPQRRLRRRQQNGGLVHIAQERRSLVRDGAIRSRAKVGSLLGKHRCSRAATYWRGSSAP